MPAVRPSARHFSSGPCAKRPGWTPEALKNALVGRSHRSKPGKAKLKDAIERTRALLGIPADYRIGIVPASDTGAMEMAMWSLLGPREIDIYAWESFGEDWVTDTVKQLKLKAQVHKAPYGQLPELKADPKDRDTVFCGTAPHRACACRMATGLRPIATASPSATPPRRSLRWTCRGTNSMSSPSPGRRCWAARPRTAC